MALAVVLCFAGLAQALDKAHLHIAAGISPNSLLYRYTIDKGFYPKKG